MKTITHSISFSIVAFVTVLAMLLMPFITFAATNWELEAPTGVLFICGGGEYPHTIDTIVQDEDGNLEGTGSYDSDSNYTWDLEGTINVDVIEFTITYTNLAFGSVYNLTGTIDEDGSVSGTVDSNCQTFTMPVGSLVAVANDPTTKDQCKKGGWEAFGFKNQGQCVRFVETGKDSR